MSCLVTQLVKERNSLNIQSQGGEGGVLYLPLILLIKLEPHFKRFPAHQIHKFHTVKFPSI